MRLRTSTRMSAGRDGAGQGDAGQGDAVQDDAGQSYAAQSYAGQGMSTGGHRRGSGSSARQVRTWVAGLAAATVMGSVVAAGKPVDVSDVAIGGVKLGMSHREAIRAAAAYFKVEADQIRPDKLAADKGAAGAGMPMSFSYASRTETLRVSSVSRTPPDPDRPTAVTQITYERKGESPEVNQSVRDAAVAKYGEPTSGKTNQGAYAWCAQPGEMGCAKSAGAVLTATGSMLTLRDRGYEERARQVDKGDTVRRPQ